MPTAEKLRFSPDLEDLPRLFFGIRGGGNDEQAVQQVDGDAMRALVVGATDAKSNKRVHIYKKKKFKNIIYRIVLYSISF